MGKQVRLSEDALKDIIMENVKKALKESRLDLVDSGMFDYKGTGTPESRGRVGKIRDKRKELGNKPGLNLSSLPNIELPGNNIKNIHKTTYDTAMRSFGGRHAKYKDQSFDELVKPLNDKMFELPEDSPQRKRIWNLYFRLKRVYDDWAEENKGASNGPSAKKLDEAIDRAISKTLKEMRGDWFSNPLNAASYDRWRTAAPGDDRPDIVTEEDFMDWIRNPGRSEISDLMDWLAEYDPDIFQKVKTGGGKNPFMEALNNGVDWKDIATEVLDVTPVDCYPGDREPD